jgi:hypothetical protein
MVVPPLAPPAYRLNSLKQGDPLALMSPDELSSLNARESGLSFERSGDSGYTFSNPQTGEYGLFDPSETTKRLVKTDTRVLTEGSPKMLLPAGVRRQFKVGQRPSSAQEFFVVPQGAVPDDYWKFNPDAWKTLENDPLVISNARRLHQVDKDGGDFEQNRDYYIKQAVDAMRRQVIAQHYGQGNIAHAFYDDQPEPEQPKVLPSKLPFGVPGVPALQVNLPGLPTMFGAVNAALGSAYDAAAGDKMWEFGRSMRDQADPSVLAGLFDASQRRDLRRNKLESFNAPEILGDGSEASKFINAQFQSRYTPEQIAVMTPDEQRKIGYDIAGEYLRTKATNDLKQVFSINKNKKEGVSEFLTEEAYSPDWSLSKLTQQAAGSAVPTAAPMLASMLGSLATGGPWGGKAASAAVTYKLSTDSEFMAQMGQWASKNGIDINNDPEVVMQQMLDLSNKDPEGFSNALREMVHKARVAGGLEAGVAFALNEGLEHIKIPGAREGSVWEAMRKIGNKDISQVLAPRIANMLQETGKEALEEYMTEVLVGLGKGVDEKIQKGDPVWESTKNSVRELMDSYKGDEPNAESEQRNTAAQIGAYMSLIMKGLTGKGNPDTALIRQARSQAARALAEKYRGKKLVTAEKIEIALADMENAATADRLDKINEVMILEGHGSLWDRRDNVSPPEMELPPNVRSPDGTPSGQDLQSEAEAMRARAEQDAKDRAAKDAEEQARRQSFNEETAAYQRAQDLENESVLAFQELKKANEEYRQALNEYRPDSDAPEFLRIRDALLDARAKYEEIERRRGK